MPRLPSSPLLRDSLLGVAVTAIAQVELAVTAEQVEGPLVWHHLVNLLILPALALRRVAPLASVGVAAVGLAMQPLMGPAPVATPYLALLFVVGSLGWYASLRAGLAGVAIVLLAGLTYDVTTTDFRWADLIVNVVIIVMAWAAGHVLRQASDRRVRTEIEADRKARDAVVAERSRIARDLHDSLAHALTLITLQAGSVRERTGEGIAQDALGSIESTGREALADMHRFLDLIGPGSGEAPGVGHLLDLVDGVRSGGLDVALDLEVEPAHVPSSVSATVYRVVQEGLTNVVRHSEARSAHVLVRRENGNVIARITDDGPPTRPRVTGGGRGLAGLQERVALFGGTLDSLATTRGWRLEARIPCPEASQ